MFGQAVLRHLLDSNGHSSPFEFFSNATSSAEFSLYANTRSRIRRKKREALDKSSAHCRALAEHLGVWYPFK